MSGLVLGLPSKGRLQAEAESLLAGVGLAVEKGGARAYRGTLAGMESVEVAFLSASEIARELAEGGIHIGITGEDLVRETIPDAERRVEFLRPLGFGRADVVVAVPELWIDVWTMEDLDDVAAGFLAAHGRRLRVATKYWNLTQGFFARHGIAVYRVVESLGATEAAPAAGLADLVVDITSTGSTLAANGLKTLEDGTILRSQAHLMRGIRSDWNESSSSLLRRFLDRFGSKNFTI